MLVPKKNRRAVYSYLFKEGVLVCKKDVFLPKHHHIEVPNLHVMALMKSLKSRGYVNEKFNWQWMFFSLTNEGIEYLREYLHVPADVLPDTLAKPQKVQPRPSFGVTDRDRERTDRPRRFGGDRDGYRGKKDGAPGDFNPEFDGAGRGGFRGGFRGRGRGGFRGGRGGAAADA